MIKKAVIPDVEPGKATVQFALGRGLQHAHPDVLGRGPGDGGRKLAADLAGQPPRGCRKIFPDFSSLGLRMSHPMGQAGVMNTEPGCRVKLEPELEAVAGEWSEAKRRALARKLRRWAHQLEVSAAIMELDARRRNGRRPVLRFVAPRQAALN
jgi:hypothetical protein